MSAGLGPKMLDLIFSALDEDQRDRVRRGERSISCDGGGPTIEHWTLVDGAWVKTHVAQP